MSIVSGESKFRFYARHAVRALVPTAWYRRRLPALLARANDYDPDELAARVDYYVRIDEPFAIPDDASVRLRDLRRHSPSAHYFDAKEFLVHFPPDNRVAYRFGDQTKPLPWPFLVKARPIDGAPTSVLFKLNRIRHFRFVDDPYDYEDKRDLLVWRGVGRQEHRREFVERFHDHPDCDVGRTDDKDPQAPGHKPRMTIEQQLGYKFILSIEGNDVATSLKWSMSSNSLCFMTRPKFETWFMEGTLEPGVHYVELAEDYSDLEAKLDYYRARPDEAQAIIAAAHAHVAPFRDEPREDLLCLLVLRKYFELSGQPVFEGTGRVL